MGLAFAAAIRSDGPPESLPFRLSKRMWPAASCLRSASNVAFSLGLPLPHGLEVRKYLPQHTAGRGKAHIGPHCRECSTLRCKANVTVYREISLILGDC